MPIRLKQAFLWTALFLFGWSAKEGHADSYSGVSSVPKVVLPATLGTWHVIAYLPGRALPKDCVSAWIQNRLYESPEKAEFETQFFCQKDRKSINSQPKIQTNRVRISRNLYNYRQWKETSLEGRLEMDPGWPARWFIGWVDYWILDVSAEDLAGPDAYFVVGGPKRKVLAIYSRLPTLKEATYQQILVRLEAQGYEHLQERMLRLR